MKTIILWLMITPGNWEVHTEVFATHAECHAAEKVLLMAVDKKWVLERFAIKDIYENGSNSFGMMWWGCHR